MIYAAPTWTQSAAGTGSGEVACPAGTLPAGGGTAVENPLIEHVAQAGFHTALAGRVDGYQASVRVSSMPRGHRAWLAVQVTCIAARSHRYGPFVPQTSGHAVLS